MRHKTHAIIALILVIVVGCKTVHTAQEGSVPVAMWSSLLIADQHGLPVRPDARDIVSKVLREQGLHPTLDEGGVSVPDDEETRAREVLLTDKRLVNSDVIVFLAIPAGTGNKTAKGFEIPAVAPRQHMQMPTTNEAQ